MHHIRLPAKMPRQLSGLVPNWIQLCQFGPYSADQTNVTRSKLKLILSEYELLKHREPGKVPSQLSESHLEYLASLHKDKLFKRMTWLDVSYKLREQTLERLFHLEQFDGANHLLFPFIGSEVILFFTRLS